VLKFVRFLFVDVYFIFADNITFDPRLSVEQYELLTVRVSFL